MRLLVPRELVETAEGGATVWVADSADGVARRRAVQLGRAGTGQLVEVTQGLTALDKLIVGGREGLSRMAIEFASRARTARWARARKPIVRNDGSGIGKWRTSQEIGVENMALVEIRKLTKQFRKGDEVITPLQEVNLDIERGDFVSLMGASGSGKSTLLNAIAGIDRPTSGEIVVNGTDITQAVARPARRLAGGQHRLHLSDAQPDSRAHGLREHRAAALALADVGGRAAEASRDRPGSGQPARSGESLSAATVRRPGAARGHCPGDRRQSHDHRRRRTDRRSRLPRRPSKFST